MVPWTPAPLWQRGLLRESLDSGRSPPYCRLCHISLRWLPHPVASRSSIKSNESRQHALMRAVPPSYKSTSAPSSRRRRISRRSLRASL
eukprot:scaffold121200_cov46-Tisochrysis_lutea.AAC.1